MAQILLVDDEEDILETTKFTMETLGYDCITASNGMEGLKKALSVKPDLVLLDMMMPIMTGMEVLKKIREVHSNKEIPVIMLTAVSDRKHVQDILSLSVSDYCIKPFDINVLIEKVKKILGSPEKTVALAAEDDIVTFTVNQDGGSVTDIIVEAFDQMMRLIQDGKRKFIINFGNINALNPSDLRRIGDGIGMANEERVDLKFVIPTAAIKEQFLSFYETKDATIYKSYNSALDAFKQQKAVKVVERDGIIIVSYKDIEASLFNILKLMFSYVETAVSEGKKRFILSFEDFFNIDKIDFKTMKLIVSNFLEYRRKGIDIRFVFPTSKAKEWFSDVAEGINLEFYLSEDEAVEKFKREWVFSLNENADTTVISIKDSCSQGRIWGILKGIFRNIFELGSEGKKKFVVNMTNLSSLDSQSLKLIEGATANALSEGISIKFVAQSATIQEQFERYQGTKDLAIYPSLEEATA